MTAEQFTYWLQGFFELSGTTTLNEQQVKIVKDHIALVLNKVTPEYAVSGRDIVYVKADGTLDIKTHLSC
jgi:chorismate mutase